jgi:hypothetical protein
MGLGITRINLNKDRWSPVRDFNPGSHKHEGGATNSTPMPIRQLTT